LTIFARVLFSSCQSVASDVAYQASVCSTQSTPMMILTWHVCSSSVDHSVLWHLTLWMHWWSLTVKNYVVVKLSLVVNCALFVFRFFRQRKSICTWAVGVVCHEMPGRLGAWNTSIKCYRAEIKMMRYSTPCDVNLFVTVRTFTVFIYMACLILTLYVGSYWQCLLLTLTPQAVLMAIFHVALLYISQLPIDSHCPVIFILSIFTDRPKLFIIVFNTILFVFFQAPPPYRSLGLHRQRPNWTIFALLI